MPRKKKEEAVEVTTEVLFDTPSNTPIEKKPKRKKPKAKIWLLVKGWTRENPISKLTEIDEATINEFTNLMKAIKANKSEKNWADRVEDVYGKYPKIKEKVIDKFEAYVPTGIDLNYMDESVRIIRPGSADSIDSITIVRGTEEDIL